MLKYLLRLVAPFLSLTMLFVLSVGGCAGARESGEDGETRPRRRSVRPEPTPTYQDLALAAPSRDVQSIQLYRGADERQLPVIVLNSGQTLMLEFDLMAPSGRPLSIYFYHADRTWERDLMPSEYLSSFQRDDLLDYAPSRATEVQYTHYEYEFPNSSISFLISGNYVLRITEQGREDQVLFERAFCVSEAQNVDLGIQNVMVGGLSFPSTLPVVRFAPPDALQGNLYDFNVCFVRNGQFERARCTDRPQLAALPYLDFYLEPELAFEPEPGDYFLDLASLRVGPQIEGTDFSRVPYRVTLEPDYAQFPGDGIAPLLSGQTIISSVVRDVPDPDVAGEYALVGFSFVPPEEQPLEGELLVTGSFNGWQYDPANRLEWLPDRGRYEGNVLLKQGQYEYRYFTPDRRLRRLLRAAPPRAENLYFAFVYYNDIRYNTDRLLAVAGTLAQ